MTARAKPARSPNAKANAVADKVASRFGAGNARKPKGYASGGLVANSPEGSDWTSGTLPRLRPANPQPNDPIDHKPAGADDSHVSGTDLYQGGDKYLAYGSPLQMAKGGKVKHVTGKPVGKDDGMIPAKRGEYVVKKSSTTKYGPAKMAAVNKGTAKVTTKGRK